MRPIRVVELTAGVAIGAPLGGGARFVLELTRAFDRAVVAPYLANIWRYDTQPEERWQRILQQESIPHDFAASWDEQRLVQSCVLGLRGLWTMGNLQADIIHSHGEFTDIAAILLKRRWGASRLVRTRHSTVEWPKRPALGRIFWHWVYPLCFNAERAVSKSAQAALNARPLSRGLRRPADVIYNAIDFNRFDPTGDRKITSRERLGLPVQGPVLGSIGMLVNKKGLDTLLHGFARVLNTPPDAHLVIVGEGPERARLEQMAASLGLGGQVLFTGAQSHVELILPAFDLYVSASFVEGLPTVLLESIASGVPVVATNIPGNNEVIEDGVSGHLMPVGDPQALAATITAALAAPALTKQMAQIALQMARERFAIQPIAAQYTSLFRCLLDGYNQ